MIRVLVTGAGGFVGGAVTQALARAVPGSAIIATCRRPSQALLATAAADRHVTIVDDVDLSDARGVARLPHDVTHAVHAAALARFGGQPPRALHQANVLATQHLLAHLIATSGRSLERLMYVSTFGVHDRRRFDTASTPLTETSPFAPVSAYGRTKLQAERLVRLSGVPHAIVRLSWIYGADMRSDSHIRVLAAMSAANHPLTHVDFPGRVSVASIDDTAGAIVALLIKPKLRHVAYLVAHEQPVRFGDMFRLFHALVGRRPAIVPGGALRAAARLASPLLPMKLRSLCQDYYVCSIARLVDEGIVLPTPFAHGIRASADAGGWFAST